MNYYGRYPNNMIEMASTINISKQRAEQVMKKFYACAIEIKRGDTPP